MADPATDHSKPVAETRDVTQAETARKNRPPDEEFSADSDHAAQVLADGASKARLGWFRYYFDDEHWEWSDEVARMHGYQPGSVTPTTQLVLSHTHPDDHQLIADTLERILRTHQPFSNRKRIYDVEGRIHHVVVVADLLTLDSGRVIGTYGFYMDVTAEADAQQGEISTHIAQLTENRSAIEQAKGMIMAIYGVDAETAFATLKWRSQETNVKLRRLAEQVVTDFTAAAQNETLPLRADYDHLLLTAHLRIDPNTPVQDDRPAG